MGRREGSDVPASLPKSSMSCLLHQSLFWCSVCGVVWLFSPGLLFLFSGLFCSSLLFSCFELQKTQHQLMQSLRCWRSFLSNIGMLKIKFLVVVSQTSFSSFISSEATSQGWQTICCSVLRHLCHEPPCHSCFQPVILDPAIHGRFLSVRVSLSLVCRTLGTHSQSSCACWESGVVFRALFQGHWCPLSEHKVFL